ncbi:MAG: carboxymuconolactone decarboxylase family protein [Acidiferrobacteraceae bacterium]
MRDGERFDRGWKKLQEIDEEAARRVLDSLSEVSPDLGRYIVEFVYGDVFGRSGLDLKSREMVTVGILAAMGNASPQLRVHINSALNVGCSREEIVETLIQTAVYAGFPAALNATAIAREVFEERDKKGTNF